MNMYQVKVREVIYRTYLVIANNENEAKNIVQDVEPSIIINESHIEDEDNFYVVSVNLMGKCCT